MDYLSKRVLSTEESEMNQSHLRNCSAFLIIRKMQIKSLWDTICYLLEWLISKILMIAYGEKDME